MKECVGARGHRPAAWPYMGGCREVTEGVGGGGARREGKEEGGERWWGKRRRKERECVETRASRRRESKCDVDKGIKGRFEGFSLLLSPSFLPFSYTPNSRPTLSHATPIPSTPAHPAPFPFPSSTTGVSSIPPCPSLTIPSSPRIPLPITTTVANLHESYAASQPFHP
ncbi:hypothetical protein E2C01_063415 [Portunus trituberculatus]|uniref:Uncharacterized protein n=1 Tax=Portunus trituberculatus TaxID=210409 RepID=A0A5B7HHI7_PORTR|nr:hypothetical protein [Portunus trituberculatus]